MLGLAVLFGLAVWVAITIGAVFLGAKALKIWWAKPYAGLLGGFLGFMLTMGGFIVYWAVEYIQIQRTVTHLCETEGGITVYVTPEEWRKQIGEEEWGILFKDWKNLDSSSQFTFEGKIYYGFSQLNKRVNSYATKDNIPDYIGDREYLYVDKITSQVLFKSHEISVGAPAIANSLEGLKFWLSSISDCGVGSLSYDERFFSRKYTNYQSIKEE